MFCENSALITRLLFLEVLTTTKQFIGICYLFIAQIDDEDVMCGDGSPDQVDDGDVVESLEDDDGIEKSVPLSSLAWEAYELSSDWSKSLKGVCSQSIVSSSCFVFYIFVSNCHIFRNFWQSFSDAISVQPQWLASAETTMLSTILNAVGFIAGDHGILAALDLSLPLPMCNVDLSSPTKPRDILDIFGDVMDLPPLNNFIEGRADSADTR